MTAVEWLDGFDGLEAEWDALADTHRLPFLRHAWFETWWSAFGDGAALRICAVREDGRLAALLPLCERGGRLEALANGHSPVFRPLGRPEAVDVAVREALAHTSSLELLAVPADTAARIAGAARERRLLVYDGPHQSSPVVRLDGGFEAYRATISRSTRKDIERRRRKLESEQEAAVRAFLAPDDLDAALTAGFEVESSGWKGERGTSILSSPATERFYRRLAHRFAARGALKLAAIEVGGRLAAFDLCLADYGGLWVLKGGYDEAMRAYAPGLVLTLAEIEAACGLGLDRVELLGDATPWKLKFTSEVREQRYVHVHRRRPVPLARHAWHAALRPRLRTAYHRLLPGRARRG